jgi:DNA-binding CsgD family transcriptional regulator/N-acetylneuraminic acid mutarotase
MAEDSQLSEREREILKLIATGATNQQIAGNLGISINTVKVHARNIFGKIGAGSRTEATLYAVRSGLVDMSKAVDTGSNPALLSPELPATKAPAVSPLLGAEPSKPRGLSRSAIAIIGTIGGLIIAIALAILLGVRFPASVAPTSVPPTVIATSANIPPIAANWTAQRDVPIGLSAAAAASVDGKIYLIGGRSGTQVSAQTLRYDPSSNAWATLPEKPTPVANIQAVVLGGKIYLPGGEKADGSVSDVLEVYDPANQSWLAIAKLPQPRSRYGLAAIDGRLYLFGGWDGTKERSETLVYDPVANQWGEQADMPTARAYCAAVAVDGKIYVLGGEALGTALSANEQFTPAIGGKGTWAKVTPLDQPRTRFGASAISNNIVVVGGATNDEPSRYDVRSATWQTFKAPALPLGTQPAVLTRDSSVFIAAGDPAKAASAFYELKLLFTVTITLP